MLRLIIRLLLSLLPILTTSYGTTTTVPPPPTTIPTPTQTDKLEETVINSMLKIVDEKFDTISSRITQMERALNGLQFYSIRQFRSVSSTLQSSAALTQSLHSKLSINDIETRTLKETVKRVGHEVMSLQDSNTAIFQKIERSIGYVNRNINEKTAELKIALESLQDSGPDEESLLRQAAAGLAAEEFNAKQETVLNCTVDLRLLEEKLESKFNELRDQSGDYFDRLHNQSDTHFEKLKYQSQTSADKMKVFSQNQVNKLINNSDLQFQRLGHQSQAQLRQLNNISQIIEKKEKADSRGEDEDNEEDEVFIDNEMLFLAISNMTSHVVQSVSFIRHTDSMLERIIANTETMAYEQEQMRKELIEAVSYSHEPSNQISNSILEGGTNIAQAKPEVDQARTLPEAGAARAQPTGCTLPESVLSDIAKFSKNGSQLFEILTDLAQMSQASLSSSIVELQDELVRMEETRNKIATETRLPAAFAPNNLALEKLLNTTRATFKITEAMASNTGWIPYIYHNVQHVEGQLNRSMSVTTRFLSELRSLKGKLVRHDPNAQTNGLDNNVSVNVEVRDRRRRNNNTGMMSDEVLGFIYDTNVELKRIMPALTRLIAEPEPLITLVGGRRANEGRVEIYHESQWGTLCDERLGHVEASAICRHLGYVGGISAGAGQFGAGSGMTWSLNLTCMRSLECPVITQNSAEHACGHQNDFGVICDHMLRLVQFEESNDVNTGLVEIYHKTKWRPICGYGFGRNEAHVACKQMGYSAGWIRDARGRTRGSDDVWMTNVSCRGTEIRLDGCRHNSFGERRCSGLRPAAVTCE